MWFCLENRDDSGFPRTPDILLKFCGTHVSWLDVFKMITSTCGLCYLGGSATAGIGVIIVRVIVVLHFKTSKRFGSNEFNWLFWSKLLITYLYSSYSSLVMFKDYWWNSILRLPYVQSLLFCYSCAFIYCNLWCLVRMSDHASWLMNLLITFPVNVVWVK
jgi:hypothetical protein